MVLAVLLASGAAVAWGPTTQKYICSESVKFVWGTEAVDECIPVEDTEFLAEFCGSAYSVMGGEYEEKCLKAVEEKVDVHPSLISSDMFRDTGNHYDFHRCPIHKGSAKDWVCGDRDSRPAYDMAEKWFKEAESASDRCMRIYHFCVAASYYSDSESILRSIRYVENNCVNNIEASIDRSIENGLADWSSNQLCRFNNGLRGSSHRDYQQRMGESSSTVNRIIANLTGRGVQLKSMPYRPKRGVVVLANTIDHGLASEFLEYLSSHDVNVIHSNATEFERLRYNERVILLGGQNAPEGVGGIVDKVLSKEEEDSLLTPGASFMFTFEGFWQTSQKVIVLAGYGAEDTRSAWRDNLEKVLAAVKVGLGD